MQPTTCAYQVHISLAKQTGNLEILAYQRLDTDKNIRTTIRIAPLFAEGYQRPQSTRATDNCTKIVGVSIAICPYILKLVYKCHRDKRSITEVTS